MALVFFCGWGTGTTNELENVTGTCSIDSSIKRTQSYAFRVNPTTTAVGHAQARGFSSSGAKANIGAPDCFVRVYIYVATAPASGSEEILTFNTGIFDKLAVRLNSDRTLALYDATQAQIGSNSATALPLNQWVRLEVYCGTGVGATATLRIDGTTAITGTATLSNNTASVKIGKVNNRNGQSIDVYYDDLAIDNATWIGPGRILYLTPNAQGVDNQFTGGFADVAVPWDDGTYIQTSGVADQAETWGFTDYTGLSSAKIAAAMTLMRVVRHGGSNGSLKLRRRAGGTAYDLGSAVTTSSSTILMGTVDTSPPGGGAWTASLLDGWEGGAIEASTNASRVLGAVLAVANRDPSPGTGAGAGLSRGRLGVGIGIGVS